MGKYFYIEDNDIVANISYIVDDYRIGLHIGKMYTILQEKFESEKEAITYIFKNFGYVSEMKDN